MTNIIVKNKKAIKMSFKMLGGVYMEILNVKELALYLSCSESTIRNLIRDNEIPFFRIGKKINFNKEAINTWIKNQEIQNTLKIESENNIKSLKFNQGVFIMIYKKKYKPYRQINGLYINLDLDLD